MNDRFVDTKGCGVQNLCICIFASRCFVNYVEVFSCKVEVIVKCIFFSLFCRFKCRLSDLFFI